MTGLILWITGLSGAGKSSLANAVGRRLKLAGRPVAVLDGDELRWAWNDEAEPAYSRTSRVKLALRYARLAALLSRQDLDVIVATISLFKEVHSWNRSALDNYTEIYLRTPLEELRRRDVKGLYRRYDCGEVREVAGLDIPIDEPAAPDLLFDFTPGVGVESLADATVRYLQQKGAF